jgi:hypothetical protein
MSGSGEGEGVAGLADALASVAQIAHADKRNMVQAFPLREGAYAAFAAVS